MTGRVTTFMSCKLLSHSRKSLICFHNVGFKDISRTSLWNFTTWCLFMLYRFLLSRFIMHSQRNRINYFDNTERKLFCTYGKMNGTLGVEIFCVFIVQIFEMLQAFIDMKIWRSGSCVCAVTQAVVCSWRHFIQQMTVGYTRCISKPIN